MFRSWADGLDSLRSQGILARGYNKLCWCPPHEPGYNQAECSQDQFRCIEKEEADIQAYLLMISGKGDAAKARPYCKRFVHDWQADFVPFTMQCYWEAEAACNQLVCNSLTDANLLSKCLVSCFHAAARFGGNRHSSFYLLAVLMWLYKFGCAKFAVPVY